MPGQPAPSGIKARPARLFPDFYIRKGGIFQLLVSLAMGGVIFLCTDYVIINTRLHDERALKSDDGLGAGYQVLLETGERMNSIPEETARSIAGLPGVERVHTVSGLPCQILFAQGNSCGRTTLQKSTENIRRSATAYRRKQKTAALRSNAISSAMTTICSPSWKLSFWKGKSIPAR